MPYFPRSKHPSGAEILGLEPSSDPNAINYEVYERLGGRQPAQGQIDAYNQALLDYYRRIMHFMVLAGNALYGGGPAEFRRKLDWMCLNPGNLSDQPGYTGRLTLRVAPTLPLLVFPAEWAELVGGIEHAYALDRISLIDGVTLVPFDSVNVPKFPGVNIDKTGFGGPEDYAIALIVHEAMHDRFIGHEQLKVLVPTKITVPQGSDAYSRFVAFLKNMKTCDGKTVWQKILEQAGAAPTPPKGYTRPK